jgi:hypothetical protein
VDLYVSAAAIALLLLVESLQQRISVPSVLARCPSPVRWAVYYAAVYSIIRFGVYGHEQFIYFQF